MTQARFSSTGRFETENASKYLQQLCKHFAHKASVTYDAERGEAALPPGLAKLEAQPDALIATLSANDFEGLNVSKGIIDSHLQRFAFREGFEAMVWQD